MGEITGNGTAVTGLGGAKGYGETQLPRGDDTVAQVDVSAVFGTGFTLGSTHYDATQLYISTDGLISFGAGVSGVTAAIPVPFFAIFHGDVDTRLDGEGAESGGVWLDADVANDCVTITWDHVGFYRRNASLTDTFQMQIFDRGGGRFDVVYRYQSITWTSGDLQGGWGGLDGTAAQIGYRIAATGTITELAASGNQSAELALPQTLGNTGVAGLWVFSFGTAGPIAGPITGTATADTLTGTSANDTMRGLSGSDLLLGSAGADLMDGGSGWDRASYTAATTGLKIDLMTPALNTGMAAGDSFVSVESFTATAFADMLLGSSAANWFDGGAGGDDLQGRDGNDSLFGNAGADLLSGGIGLDSLNGGDGDDTLSGNQGNDMLTGGAGSDALYGGDGSDVLSGKIGNDMLYGGPGTSDLADTLYGGDGRDILYGGEGNDSLVGGLAVDALYGGNGADILSGMEDADDLMGGLGNDQLYGGSGNDRLNGDAGADRMSGGLGADIFVNAGLPGHGQDWISDFSNAEGDRLVFGIATATRADFAVTLITLPGAGLATVAEVQVTHIPTGQLIWTIVDGADEATITLNAGPNTYDLL